MAYEFVTFDPARPHFKKDIVSWAIYQKEFDEELQHNVFRGVVVATREFQVANHRNASKVNCAMLCGLMYVIQCRKVTYCMDVARVRYSCPCARGKRGTAVLFENGGISRIWGIWGAFGVCVKEIPEYYKHDDIHPSARAPPAYRAREKSYKEMYEDVMRKLYKEHVRRTGVDWRDDDYDSYEHDM